MDLIKKMLSIPPEVPLTTTQSFTYVSTFVAYLSLGMSMFLAPDLWNIMFQLDFSFGGRGYFRFFAMALVDIGFCCVVMARNKSSQIPNSGPLLGTIFNRLVVVNAKVVIFYRQGIINALFGLIFSVLDSSLAIITYLIWSRETAGASLKKFLVDLWSTINPFAQRPLPYAIFLALGFVHFAWNELAPSILISSGVVPSEIQGHHAEGLLKANFALTAILGLIQMYSAGSQNDSCPIGCVFYRLFWNIPILFVLGFTSQIPTGLMKIAVVYDAIFCILTFLLFAVIANKARPVTKAN